MTDNKPAETGSEEELRAFLKNIAEDEITGHYVYKNLAGTEPDEHNKKLLLKIAEDEMRHYNFIMTFLDQHIEPNSRKVRMITALSRILGLNFGLKLMENVEVEGQEYLNKFPDNLTLDGRRLDLRYITQDEEQHEKELIGMIKEEKLKYMSSVVLGLNDALVELTGALAGYTLAFQNSRLIALTGLITGISASFSMASSEYLSSRQELGSADAKKGAVYTGITYLVTVLLLVLPFLFLSQPVIALAVTLAIALAIIFVFNYYNAVARDQDFKRNFKEMAFISMGVAGFSFIIGLVLNKLFNIPL